MPFLFGVATATLVAGEADYIVALINASPLWYAVLLIGGRLPRRPVHRHHLALRHRAGLLLGVPAASAACRRRCSSARCAFVFILVGRLAFDLIASVNAFIGAIVICTTPWMIIMTIGYVVRRGYYAPPDLQVFNQGRTAARYWFNNGVNWRGMVAWIPAAIAGPAVRQLPAADRGARSATRRGGVDISLPVSPSGLAAVLYLAHALRRPGAALRLRSRRARAGCPPRDGEAPAVVDDPRASAHRRPRAARRRPSRSRVRLMVERHPARDGHRRAGRRHRSSRGSPGRRRSPGCPASTRSSDVDVAVVGRAVRRRGLLPARAPASARRTCGSRRGCCGPYNPAADVEPFAAQQVVDAGDIAVNPFDIEEAIGQIEAGARAPARARPAGC